MKRMIPILFHSLVLILVFTSCSLQTGDFVGINELDTAANTAKISEFIVILVYRNNFVTYIDYNTSIGKVIE